MTRKQEWSDDDETLLRCNGDCSCHRCCVPYDGEYGPHCEDCEPERMRVERLLRSLGEVE